MIVALVSGFIFRKPEYRTSKSGKQFVTAAVRVKDGDGSQFVRVVAFSESAMAELMRLSDGDTVSAQGSFKAELYSKEHGDTPRLSLSIVADHVLPLRQPPKERKAKAPEPPPNDTRPRQERRSGTWAPGGGPDDSIPFGDNS
jgi:single-stranded DNA-binding protein